MPGGFVRIGDPGDIYAISLQRGALTADVWIPSKTALVETTLLPTPDRIQIQRASGTLPSRAADNLFWLGRYIERTEGTLRLVRALLDPDVGERSVAATISGDHVAAHRLGRGPGGPASLAADRDRPRGAAAWRSPGSVPALAHAAHTPGRSIRDRLSPDTWHDLDPPRRDLRCAARRLRFRGRHVGTRRGGAADHRLVLGPCPGKHDAARRLALSRTRPPHRTGDRDLPVRAAVRRQARPQPRYAARAVRQPHHLSAALLHGGGAGAGDRPDPARSPPIRARWRSSSTRSKAISPPCRTCGPMAGSSLPRQISMATAAKLRTADAFTVDDTLILAIETALMHLSEAISSTYLGRNEPVEAREDLPS